jgi:exosortase family protein XrtF
MKDKAIILFIVKFIGLYLLLNTAYGFWYESYHPQADPLTYVVTRQTAWIISMLEPGITAEQYGDAPEIAVRQAGKTVIDVFEGCNGLNVMIVFLSFIIAFSRSWRGTTLFSFAGIAAIYVANLGRVVFLFFIAKYYPHSLYFFHKYLFTGGLYLLVFVMWYLWIQRFRKPANA